MAHSADRWAEDPRKHMSHHAQLSMVKWLRDAMELKGNQKGNIKCYARERANTKQPF